jgi:hypothetical protein
MRLKLFNEEKAAWKYDICAWAEDYVKQHPGAFMLMLYNTLRVYMKELSHECSLTFAYVISTKLYNGDVKDLQYVTGIQQSFVFYHKKA